MPTLAQVAQEVAEELTRGAISPSLGKNVYNPALVALGERLKESLNGNHDLGLRDDVLEFCRKMSAVMNEKENEKAGNTVASQALNEVQFQLGKFQRIPFPSVQEIQRILVHVANWAMIGCKSVEREGKFR